MIQPDAKYVAKVCQVELPEPKPGGAQCILVTFETSDGEISKYLSLSAKAMPYTKKNLETLGIGENHLGAEEFWEDPGKYMIGAECQITTKLGEWNNEPRVEVEWINSLRKSLPPSAARALATRFRGEEVLPPPTGDDDVPF